MKTHKVEKSVSFQQVLCYFMADLFCAGTNSFMQLFLHADRWLCLWFTINEFAKVTGVATVNDFNATIKYIRVSKDYYRQKYPK
jgi:hypothetical protein